jgi:MSHA pilin protein MshC
MDNLPQTRYKKSSATGFTLIELVVVIIVLGVLVISAYSQLGSNQGYAEYTYQSRIISALRNTQTRAMHDTRRGICFILHLNSSPAAFGPPARDFSAPGNFTPSCGSNIDYGKPDYIASVSESEMSDDGISLQAESGGSAISFIRFDSLGRPIDHSQSLLCESGCEITLTGESTVRVCVESQGYIHACE